MITSTSNAQVKKILQLQKKAKARRQQQLYVAEGIRMFCEAPEHLVSQVYVSESFLNAQEHRNVLAGKRYEVLSDTVFARVSDTKTPQGILCLMKMPDHSPKRLMQDLAVLQDSSAAYRGGSHLQTETNEPGYGENGMGVWLVLENIQDPGNVGTMFRTGEGAGVSGVIMDGHTADIFNPKTIRSTMGSIYRMPFYITDKLEDAVAMLKECHIKVYAAHLGGSVCYDEPDYKQGAAFLIGNEGNGLTRQAAALADTYIRIPMGGQLESLNAAMAAGILMYEANRQRRKSNKK